MKCESRAEVSVPEEFSTSRSIMVWEGNRLQVVATADSLLGNGNQSCLTINLQSDLINSKCGHRLLFDSVQYSTQHIPQA